MRLASAIRLGSLLMPAPMPNDTRYCAIGMGLKAAGRLSDNGNLNYASLMDIWPWLRDVNMDCPGCATVLSWWGVVSHTFDAHVFGDKSMTIEQLCDFIDSIDPTPRVTSRASQSNRLRAQSLRRLWHD